MATTRRSSSLSFFQHRPSFSRSDSIDSLFTPPSNFISRLRARKPSNASNTISPTEAVWFLSLPEKVRRQHFTKEEQILIRAKSEIALLDTSPETLAHVEEAHTDHSNHLRTRSVAHDRSNVSVQLGRDARNMSVDTSGSSSPRRWRTPDVCQSQFAGYSQSPKRQQSVPRSPTIPEVHYNSSNTSGAGSPSSDTIRRPSTARSMNQTAHRAAAPPPLDTKQPLYLKDPSTKALLRDCLAASRFEETLAFGFPTGNSAASWSKSPVSAPDSGAPVRKSSNNSFFFATGRSSSDESAASSSIDEVEPQTPDSLIQPQIIRTKSLNPRFIAVGVHEEEDEDDEDEDDEDEEHNEGAADPPTVLRNGSNTSYFEELMSRDMTLRMTLTKPELRASDEELYGWQDSTSYRGSESVPPLDLIVDEDEIGARDPLALEDLTFSDDVTGRHGAFAQALEKKKGIRGLWHKRS